MSDPRYNYTFALHVSVVRKLRLYSYLSFYTSPELVWFEFYLSNTGYFTSSDLLKTSEGKVKFVRVFSQSKL